MGKIRYIQDIRSFFKKSIVVDINSLKRFIQKQNGNEEYIHLIINNMVKKGEIKRITRGYYSYNDDPVLSVFCFKPSYTGLQSALSIHNLWEQETIPIIITTKKVRQGVREINGANIMLRRISPKYFFGIGYIKENSFYIPVSDIEKTFIDMVYYKQNIDKSLIKIFKRKINKKKLEIYIKKYPKNVSYKVNLLMR